MSGPPSTTGDAAAGSSFSGSAAANANTVRAVPKEESNASANASYLRGASGELAGAASLARARQGGRFVGVDERAYPADYAVLARYNPALRGLVGRWPVRRR